MPASAFSSASNNELPEEKLEDGWTKKKLTFDLDEIQAATVQFLPAKSTPESSVCSIPACAHPLLSLSEK